VAPRGIALLMKGAIGRSRSLGPGHTGEGPSARVPCPCVRSRWASVLAIGLVAGLCAGCFPARKPPELIDCERQVGRLSYENDVLGEQLAERDGKIQALRSQLTECRDLPTDLISRLFTVQRLKIAKLTGGADYDGEPGDDGITVYLTPLDRDGHAIKAAGEIEVFLYDLTTPGKPRELSHYVMNEPPRLSKAWYSGWMTNHYTIRCEWSPGVELPASREVQIRATFLDWITGEKLVATKTVNVSRVDPD